MSCRLSRGQFTNHTHTPKECDFLHGMDGVCVDRNGREDVMEGIMEGIYNG